MHHDNADRWLYPARRSRVGGVLSGGRHALWRAHALVVVTALTGLTLAAEDAWGSKEQEGGGYQQQHTETSKYTNYLIYNKKTHKNMFRLFAGLTTA